MRRLPPVPGEWIDRDRPLTFRFEGRSFRGFAGDTLTSALLAEGESMLGRSFKYHRPRGVLSFANHDVNAVVQLGDQPNARADVTPLDEGMTLTAVNTFGGLRKDRASLLGAMARFLPVGFYYKAFHTKALFPLWERVFRALTGLGKVDLDAPRWRTPKRYGFCDVLVIGAGPSGLAAALAAAEQGARVTLVDENARPGGSGGYALGADPGRARQTAELVDAARAHPRIELITGAYAAGYYADHWVPLVTPERMIKMRARAVIVASGAYEQPAVFRNNDLPGVMLASAAQRLLYRHAVQPMHRAVVLVANADGYRAALDLAAHGVKIAAVIDLRPQSCLTDAELALTKRGIRILPGSCIVEARPGDGGRVASACVGPFEERGNTPTITETIDCDGILMSVGWAPTANLLYQAGTRMRYEPSLAQFVPDVLPEGVFACGRVNGTYTLDARLLDGRRAGSAAAAHAGFGEPKTITVPPETDAPNHPWPMIPHPKGKNFVDFDEDLQFKDFENAVQEGFDNIELLKRFSTVGMGPSQGKHSNMNALRILARLTGRTPGQVGSTTARPMFHPVPMAILGGRGFHPERRTPMHDQHEALGAVWMPAGDWRRPEYYARPDVARDECIREEARSVREGVGLIDVGTLGKLEIIGPDAAAFLERVYTSRYSNMKVGMTRYALMCDESGVVIDDGVVARLAEDHFYFTTTTSGATAVYRELSRLNLEWRMDCGIVNHTGAHAAVNLAGPRAREVLAAITALDLSAAAFPYLAVREGKVAGIPARLMRVGFVGEWGYEIHVPARSGAALWEALMKAGAAHGIRPFGVEAQRLLRLEKGHIIIGQDTDGLTTPLEIGMDWALKMDKPFFVGQRSMEILARKPRKQTLVGFTLPEHGLAPKECHLVIERNEIAGRVTSIAWSPALQRHIGLAFVDPDLAARGHFRIRTEHGAMIEATVSPTPFYDPDNLKQKEVS
ncbi:MAG: FAD-dependent oxidoreductase [Pseudomonadota bacterium]